MRIWNQRRINRNLDARLYSRDLFGDPKQFYCVTELFSKLHIDLRDLPNAFGMNFMMIDPKAMRQRCQYSNLVLRIFAVDVEVRRRFGVTLLLRIEKNIGELRAFLLHARKDVIAGTV